jgi:branched-chain amino acid transport system permease protein
MDLFLQGILSSLASGSMYALIAIGYSLIVSTMDLTNFAQGEFFMVGAFFGLTFYVWMGLPFGLAFLLAILATALLTIIIERLAFKPLYKSPINYLLLSTIGVSILLKNLARVIWGTETYAFPSVLGDKPFSIGKLVIIPQNIWIICVGILFMIILSLFLNRTNFGTAMRAVSMNKLAASLMGIKLSVVTMSTMAISGVLGAVAGLMMAPVFHVDATMGSLVGLKAFTAAVLGGYGDLRGAVLGGLLLGMIETLGSLFISSNYRDAIAFIVLFIILFVRPQGIMGKAKVVKV